MMNVKLIWRYNVSSQPSNAEEAVIVQNQRNVSGNGNGTHKPALLLDGYVSDRSYTIELPGCTRIIDRNNATDYIFPAPSHPETISKRAILAGTNEEVDEWNEEVQKLNLFLTESLASRDALAESGDPRNILRNILTDDVLNSFNKIGVPPHTLKLKINSKL